MKPKERSIKKEFQMPQIVMKLRTKERLFNLFRSILLTVKAVSVKKCWWWRETQIMVD